MRGEGRYEGWNRLALIPERTERERGRECRERSPCVRMQPLMLGRITEHTAWWRCVCVSEKEAAPFWTVSRFLSQTGRQSEEHYDWWPGRFVENITQVVCWLGMWKRFMYACVSQIRETKSGFILGCRAWPLRRYHSSGYFKSQSIIEQLALALWRSAWMSLRLRTSPLY